MRYTDQFIYDNAFKIQLKQISKPTARKEFKKDTIIYLNACNVAFNNCWIGLYRIDPKEIKKKVTFNDFDSIVNNFEFYNCCNERGNYSNFFIEVKI